ncbi:MAG: DUF3187 family protein [Pseudomonadota bacterium]
MNKAALNEKDGHPNPLPRKILTFNSFFIKALALIFLLCPYSLSAVEITPFYTQNQSPLVQIYGLPAIGEGSVLPLRAVDARLNVDLANNCVADTNPREYLVLDGESTRITLDLRYGIARGLECGVTIPYIFLSGGFLDSFIEGFHSTFGFQQGRRDQYPRNRLFFFYQRDGQQRLKFDRSSSGLGDMSLTGGWQLYQGKNKAERVVALRASLKLPTGDSDQFHGSGSTDFSLWVTASDDYKLALGHVTLFGAAGMMAMTDGQILRDQQRNWVGFGGLGVGWSPLRWLAFKIQTNAHTPFYRDSELRELNAVSTQLTMGGTLAFSERTTLDIGVTEDIIILTAPDVVFHFALRRHF